MSKSTERFWERVDWLKERKAHGCKGVWSSVRSGCDRSTLRLCQAGEGVTDGTQTDALRLQ